MHKLFNFETKNRENIILFSINVVTVAFLQGLKLFCIEGKLKNTR